MKQNIEKLMSEVLDEVPENQIRLSDEDLTDYYFRVINGVYPDDPEIATVPRGRVLF